MRGALRFRLATLLVVIAGIAAASGYWLGQSPLEQSLRSDLGLSANASLRLIDVDPLHPPRVIAVVSQSPNYRLLVAYRDPYYSGDRWAIKSLIFPDAIGGGSYDEFRDFDHYPTAAEIAQFRLDYGCVGRRQKPAPLTGPVVP